MRGVICGTRLLSIPAAALSWVFVAGPLVAEADTAPRVIYPAKVGMSMPARDIPTVSGSQVAGVVNVPRFPLPGPRVKSAAADPVRQLELGEGAAPSPTVSFEGISNADNEEVTGSSVAPPDPNGDVGPNHYVQMVNITFAVWDKSGTQLIPPTATNALWAGFGGLCESTNRGDPIVLYDPLADRWLLSQFAFAVDASGNPTGPFHECIAISTTPDPTGTYYLYDFVTDAFLFNDYPKLAVWPDAYYMAVNQFQFGLFAGAGVAAFERDKMLVGDPTAALVYFDTRALTGGVPTLAGMLPSDLDGTTPPAAGTPNYFIQFDDFFGAGDRLQIWAFIVDWINPASSTFAPLINLTTAPFDSRLCFAPRERCIDQPFPATGVDLETLSDRLMHRLAYRKFETHESMVVNHTVDADGSGLGGVRWYELRNSGSGWVIHQQGTYAPDQDHRWMGSIAMDKDGNIALGYSISSDSTFPSIGYTGRLAGDPLGTLPAGETVLIAGGGVQLDNNRWGDYSAMAVDPTDDCTFWYTQEYYETTSGRGWQTRIGAFKFPSCGDSQATRFRADLSGNQEVPPVSTPARGVGLFFLNDSQTWMLDIIITFLIQEVVAAHIHCAPAGVNGPIGVTLFTGGPVTPPLIGLLDFGIFFEPDPGNACGWADLDDVISDMRSGDTYLNVHTLAFPSGEIRGQITGVFD